jgi:hypothetical protein
LIKKIISGGQTGVDRAALDAAIKAGISHGGWVPKGRKAEDGIIPMKYNLSEMDDVRYAPRTLENIRDSDGTLIITSGSPDRGTLLTRELAAGHRKPFVVIDLSKSDLYKSSEGVLSWLTSNKIEVLNVAGPRESKSPGIYEQSLRFLLIVLKDLN